MPPPPAGRLCAELLAFYGDAGGRSAGGVTLAEVLAWPNAEWEARHDFIQWAFPTDEESRFNPDAPVLDAATAAAFRADPARRDRLRDAHARWLTFCGAVRTAAGLALSAPNPAVWHGPNHNWLRVTRVLRSLRLLGLDAEAAEFFALLTTRRAATDARTWAYWHRAATA